MNDALQIAVDGIQFRWPKSKKMRLYCVSVVADNLGKVMITEPHASKPIRHRPERPAVWDFVGNGFDVYHRTGGLPDIIKGTLMVIKDRSATRKAGEIIQAIGGNEKAKSAIAKAAEKVPIIGPTGAIGVAVDLIGGIDRKSVV